MSNSLHHFLPAVLEIQEKPPNPIARYLLTAIIAFAVIAVAWACVGKIDVVSIAEGRIIPSSRVKQIQPLQRGVVTEILVNEGQHVQAGEKLVVLDRTSTAAERERIAGELQAVEETLARDRALLEKWTPSPLRGTPPTAQEEPENPVQQLLLEQQYQQFLAQYEALQSQRDNRIAEREMNKNQIRKLEATLPVISQRTANARALTEKKLVMENDYLALEEVRLSQQHDLAVAKARHIQLEAAIREVEKQLSVWLAQAQVQTLQAIVDGERQQKNLREQLAKASDADARHVLHAPASGEVKDLAIHTVGGVVMEAQQLMLIVPEDEVLEVDAWLQNRDIGFVQEGAQARIKVHTFPFSKYGTIAATVVSVADDAAMSVQQKNMNSINANSESMYNMNLRMEKNALYVDGRDVRLVPGMQVTVEIITHQRRLIEYFLSPLKKHLQESMRER